MQPTLFSDQPFFLPLICIVMIWSMVWKGIALWKSARASSKIWFVVLLIVNSVGILEILYIYVFSKMKKETAQPNQPTV